MSKETFILKGFRSKFFMKELASVLLAEAIEQEGATEDAVKAFTIVHSCQSKFFLTKTGSSAWKKEFAPAVKTLRTLIARRGVQTSWL